MQSFVVGKIYTTLELQDNQALLSTQVNCKTLGERNSNQDLGNVSDKVSNNMLSHKAGIPVSSTGKGKNFTLQVLIGSVFKIKFHLNSIQLEILNSHYGIKRERILDLYYFLNKSRLPVSRKNLKLIKTLRKNCICFVTEVALAVWEMNMYTTFTHWDVPNPR